MIAHVVGFRGHTWSWKTDNWKKNMRSKQKHKSTWWTLIFIGPTLTLRVNQFVETFVKIAKSNLANVYTSLSILVGRRNILFFHFILMLTRALESWFQEVQDVTLNLSLSLSELNKSKKISFTLLAYFWSRPAPFWNCDLNVSIVWGLQRWQLYVT